MKTRKQTYDREIEHVQPPPKARNSLTPGNGLPKRKEERGNKENHVLITETLDPSPHTFPSKEFVLSKEPQQPHNRSSRSSLRDVNLNACPPAHSAHPTLLPNAKRHDKQQQLFQRRLSLKCTANYSQQLDNQKSVRLSMAPLRKDSTPGSLFQPSLPDERESMYSYQNSISCSDSKQRQQLRKQSIISNLVNKLEHEEDLRSIIESKLRQPLGKDRRNQSYLTDFNEDTPVSTKLKQCESEIKYFKGVIKEMSDKILELSEEKNFSRHRERTMEHEERAERAEKAERVGKELDLMEMLSKMSVKCQQCEKRERKVSREVGCQTVGEVEGRSQVNESFDFMDNLQRTLKVLDGRKH